MMETDGAGTLYKREIHDMILAILVMAIDAGGDPAFVRGNVAFARSMAIASGASWPEMTERVRRSLDTDSIALLDAATIGVIEGGR